MKSPFPRGQRGGFLIGMVIGLLLGLAIALGVALYVTKVPVPFVNKVPARPAEQDAAEAEQQPQLGSEQRPGRQEPGADPGVGAGRPARASLPPTATAAGDAAASTRPCPAPARPGRRGRRPAPSAPAAVAASAPAPQASQALAAGGDPFTYFVQAGAFARTEDAEQQRAKLAMLGRREPS